MEFEITNEMLEIAHEMSQRVSIHPNMRFENYTCLNDPDRHFKGFLGEACFSECLNRHGVKHEWCTDPGDPDTYDFLVNGQRLDVKTGSGLEHVNFLLNESQYLRRKERNELPDFYGAVQLSKDYSRCVVAGVLSSVELIEKSVIVDYQSRAYSIPYSKFVDASFLGLLPVVRDVRV